jgi:hypothetical protein
MRIFLKEMMLDLPRIVIPKPIGQLDLGERVLVEGAFSVRLPWARTLQLVEYAELHGRPFGVIFYRQVS